ncbi:MAG: chemotaxis protein CheW [Sedimentisphaerales bacterium]|nr:chemotaxis protein CheW [Sedimentisphaerales bacterium]
MSNQATETAVQSSKNTANITSNQESMIVRLSSLDNMLELAGEVIIVSSNLNAMSREIQEGVKISRVLSDNVKDLAITSSRISSDLHNLVTDVRTVGMSDLFARFRRIARDTSRRLGKVIRFELEGEEICIDKRTSEKIYDPIAHQIRNAMAHGIEDKETRQKLGKDPVGTVTVKVCNTENNTIIDVIDDGGGINIGSVKRKALQMKLVDEKTLAGLSDEALYEYLYIPGFSTAEQASATSGRGVGLDVVRDVMNQINGETRIKSEQGKGTTFSFILPKVTAVNISDALLVRAETMTFAFPISSVVASQAISVDDVTTIREISRTIKYLGNILPLFDLLEIFGEAPVGIHDGQMRVIVVEYKSKRAAFVVSDFMNPQKIVISEFDHGMKVPGLVGTAILSGRQMGLVIDLPGLFEQTFGIDKEVDIKRSVSLERISKKDDQVIDGKDAPQKVSSETKTKSTDDIKPDESVSEVLDIEQPDSHFLKEVELMLTRLNKELFTLEEKKDTETADGIFRLVHSIKGNLTMCGAEEPASITHQIETILERVRRGALELDEEAFDVFFDGSAYLEQVVQSLLANQKPAAPSDKLLAGIEKFNQEEKKAEQSVSLDGLDNAQVVLDPTGEFYLSSRRRDGAVLYLCRIEFNPGDQPHFLVAYLILRRLQRVGDVLGSFPAMADIEAGLCKGGIVVLLAPRDPKPDLLETLSENLKKYYGVEHFEASNYA